MPQLGKYWSLNLTSLCFYPFWWCNAVLSKAFMVIKKTCCTYCFSRNMYEYYRVQIVFWAPAFVLIAAWVNLLWFLNDQVMHICIDTKGNGYLTTSMASDISRESFLKEKKKGNATVSFALLFVFTTSKALLSDLLLQTWL